MSYRLFPSDLQKLEASLLALETKINADADASAAFEMRLIDLYGRWEQYLREYLLEHAARAKFGCSAATARQRAKALRAFMNNRNRTMEPKWANPQEAISFCSQLSLPVTSTIAPILGASPWKLEELRWGRNFLAHRSQETARKLMKHAKLNLGAKNLHRYALLLEAGAPKYRLWIQQMQTVSAMLPI